MTSFVATLTVTSAPPSILTQPQPQSVFINQNATFSVSASGSAPLNYQWRFGTTTISGATDASYTRTNVQFADAGNYSVIITNASGSVTSSAALLTVLTGDATIIAQWNCNNTNGTSSGPPATFGSGTSSLVGGTTGSYFGGSSVDPSATNNNGWSSTTYPAVSTGNKTAGVKFTVSTGRPRKHRDPLGPPREQHR